jgi:hypothetical protein
MKNHHGPVHPTSRDLIHEAIAHRAYALWLRSGRPGHQAESHWLEAERELVESRQSSPSKPTLSVDS